MAMNLKLLYTKLNDIATLFTNDERSHYFYILKIFPFSLKGDAKIWFISYNSVAERKKREKKDVHTIGLEKNRKEEKVHERKRWIPPS